MQHCSSIPGVFSVYEVLEILYTGDLARLKSTVGGYSRRAILARAGRVLDEVVLAVVRANV